MICTITIIDYDKPGKFGFSQLNHATEADDFFYIKVLRTEGGDGKVDIEY